MRMWQALPAVERLVASPKKVVICPRWWADFSMEWERTGFFLETPGVQRRSYIICYPLGKDWDMGWYAYCIKIQKRSLTPRILIVTLTGIYVMPSKSTQVKLLAFQFQPYTA